MYLKYYCVNYELSIAGNFIIFQTKWLIILKFVYNVGTLIFNIIGFFYKNSNFRVYKKLKILKLKIAGQFKEHM